MVCTPHTAPVTGAVWGVQTLRRARMAGQDPLLEPCVRMPGHLEPFV